MSKKEHAAVDSPGESKTSVSAAREDKGIPTKAKPVTLSLMTMSFGRTHHAKESLPKMLEAMAPTDELVIADLGENRELTDFVDSLKDPRVTHVLHDDAIYYHPSHARNLCVRHAWGDRLLSIDVDAYPSKEMLELCRLQNPKLGYISSQRSKNYGFISVPREVVHAVQGWEEALTGHTHDDMQFRSAIRAHGCVLEHISIDLKSVDVKLHPRYFQNENYSIQSAVNQAVARALRRLDPTMNNVGRAWGTGGILRRHSELANGAVQGKRRQPLTRRESGWSGMVAQRERRNY